MKHIQIATSVSTPLQMARSKKACIIFFDEVDAIGGARFDDGAGGDNEVQRTMLEIVNQLDGFDARGNIKVLMATNRPDTLDPALLRPGRLDRKIEFGLPDLKARTQIFKIHTKYACFLSRKCKMYMCAKTDNEWFLNQQHCSSQLRQSQDLCQSLQILFHQAIFFSVQQCWTRL